MNKKLVLIVIITLISVLFLGSCRSNGPVDISGLWYGQVISSNDWESSGEYVVFEITEDGKLKMGNPDGPYDSSDPVFNEQPYGDIVIYDEALGQEFKWSLSDNYLEITALMNLYYLEFAYELNDSGDQLELIMINRNFVGTFDDFQPGDRILLDLDEANDFSYYFSTEYENWVVTQESLYYY